MAKKTKTGKARKDRFYFLAKETGYRSRAAFKLIQLNRRFNFLSSSKVLIDLCAAPGGWLQVASREMPVSSLIVGVDLVPIQPIPRVKTFTADITTDKCKQILRQNLLDQKADVVLHDGAPNVGTAWSVDEYSQASLCLQAFTLATEFLKKGGWFITKVFRSRDYEPLKWVLSQFFRTVRAIKPEASRLESAEIFLVGQFYRAPDRIDGRFLDPKYVFGEVDVPKDRTAIVSAFLKDNKKRKAEGYAEGDSLYHELPLSKFLESEDPLATLAKTHKVIMDVPEVENHVLTTDAIKEDLNDIQVLGKADIKTLLKWRTKILASLKESSKRSEPNAIETDETQATDSKDVEDNEELEIETEVQRLLDEEEKQKKKRLKRVRKEKRKIAERLVLKMDHEGDHIEQSDDIELFSLSKIHDLITLQKAYVLTGDTSQTGADDLAREEQAIALKLARENYAEERRSAIEGRKRVHFDRRGDNAGDFLDDDKEDVELMKKYQRDDIYISSSESDGEGNISDESSIEFDEDDDKRDDNDNSGSNDEENNEDEDDIEKLSMNSEEQTSEDESGTSTPKKIKPQEPKSQKRSTKSVEKTKTKRTLPPGLILKDTELNKRNPLLVDLDDADETVKKKRKIASWFQSDEMKDLLAPIEDSTESANDFSDSEVTEKDIKLKAKEKKKEKTSKKRKTVTEDTAKDTQSARGLSNNKTTKAEGSINKLRRLRRPLTPEERALALKLIRSAKSRRELIESNYHRFQFFEKASDLPDWFAEDEQKHMRKPLPISKNEIETPAATMGRSISKVEEARARKKARLAKKMKRVRQKVEEISDELPETEKWQQIKQMYKKAGLVGKKRRPLHVIVNTKGGARNKNVKPPKGARIKIVDKRMKADLRGQERANRGKRKGQAKPKTANRRRHGGGVRPSVPFVRKSKGKR